MKEETKSSGNKVSSYFNIIALVAVLAIAPLVSWIYLKKGVEYRMAALETLIPKTLDKNTLEYIAPYVKADGQAKLIMLPSMKSNQNYELLYEIDDRIIEKPLFEIIAIGDDPGSSVPEKINNLSFQQMELDYNGPHDYILLDTGNEVRATYTVHEDIAKEIIRHLSIVIPMQKKKSIKLERQKKEE
ncbi:MAG: hypothetical protein ACJA01_002813 [Saprospiraceae bacterium]|jgi:hypothetical protein